MNLKTNTKKWRQSLGELGEQITAAYLTEHGYEVLERNYFAHRLGEIDLIALSDDTFELAFIEVKTRLTSQSAFEHTGQMAVSLTKQKKIINSALHYVSTKGGPRRRLRFDVVLVDYDLSRDQVLALLVADDLKALRLYARLEHVPGAFGSFY